jgi:hypothetical protein
VYERVLPADRSDVQMCLSMIVSWIAMLTGFHPTPPTLVVQMLHRFDVDGVGKVRARGSR